MTDDIPNWLPEAEKDVTPEPQQEKIIQSDGYPIRVLAGAGTGKTFTMVRKIEHLIDERGVSPDRILALTFTNNAADSMREKLNAELGSAGYDVDAYTYHSVCNEILSEYAYDAGIDPEFEVVSEAEKYAVVLEVLDEIEYRTVKPNVYGPDSHGRGAASSLLSYIGKMKRTGVPPEEIDEFLGSAERLYKLDGIPEKIRNAAGEHLGGRSVSSVSEGIPNVRKVIVSELSEIGEEGVEASVSEFLRRLVAVCDSLEEIFKQQGDELPENSHKLPKYLLGGYASGAPSGVPAMNLELIDYLEDFIDDCKTARDLNAGYAAYEKELERRNLLDFDDLVSETVDLLETEVGEEIADRWDYVFCDEFQDTDRQQFDLVTSLVSENQLFVVGDDDQAIYEWRGARVANITDELDTEYGEELIDEPLEENFRSRQPILDLANEAIKSLEGRGVEKTLRHVNEPDYEGDTVAVVHEKDEQKERAEQVLNVVKNLLSGETEELDKTYSPGDVGILVRKNSHAEPIIKAFDEAGVPYQVAGGVSSESVGVGTVVAFLKALARPEEDEVSWNRVLTMRYRLHDDDLRSLNRYEDGLLRALLEVPLEEFKEPERVGEARTDIKELLDLRGRVSLGRLYRKIKDITDIEWYLSEQERRNLVSLDGVIEEYGDGAVQPPLSGEFIEALSRQGSVLEVEGSEPTSQPEVNEESVNVMTVHKSKGLDFPVVIMPRLTEDEWEPRSRRYDGLEEALTESPEAAFREDFVERDRRESRRLLYVGITRAEDILILHGGTEEESKRDDIAGIEKVTEKVLPAPWSPRNGRLPVWKDLQAALPTSVADWTDSLAESVIGGVGGQVTDRDGEVISTEKAHDGVLGLARSSLDDDLEAESEERMISVDSLTEPSVPDPAISHSYTSIEAYEECPRQHYLDYVVNAFSEYRETNERDDSDDVSQREVGLLFHDTAEIAAQEGSKDKQEWYEICERLGGQKRAEDAVEAAKDCVDRYFELEVSKEDWEIIDAEREFELGLNGHELIGFIDAVYRTPQDDLVVVDYKATDRKRDIQNDKQLPIYLLACRDLYDKPVSRAGYAYVGSIGPETEIRGFDEDKLNEVLSEVKNSMEKISNASFDEYVSGDHCRWCRHKKLPCAPDDI